MSSRAIVFYSGSQEPSILADGNFQVVATGLYTDPADPAKTPTILKTNVELVAATPGTWKADIKAAVAATGVANGFPDLVTTNVFTPDYS